MNWELYTQCVSYINVITNKSFNEASVNDVEYIFKKGYSEGFFLHVKRLKFISANYSEGFDRASSFFLKEDIYLFFSVWNIMLEILVRP